MKTNLHPKSNNFRSFIFGIIMLTSITMSLNAQSLTVQSPNGGEVWTYGQGEIVTWTGDNLGSQIALDFSSNGGASWSYFGNAPSGPNGGSCTVSVPNIPTENAIIRVSDAANPSVSDESNAPFTVFVAPITIYVPNGDSFVFNDISMYTNWELTVSGISLLNAELSTDNGATFTTIAQNLEAGLYYSYLPVSVAEPSDSCILKLSNAANPLQYGLSQLFSILPQPKYTITYPAEGDFLNTQTSYMVNFTVENPFVEYCSAEYSIDGGNTWVYFNGVYIQGNSGSFEWVTPDADSDECLIRITDGFEPNISDTSDVFSVFPFPETPVCMVSVDSLTNFNVIIWEKPVSDMIADFLVYKETDEANVYEVIDTVGYEEITMVTDSGSNPAMRPYRYKIGFIDVENRLFPSGDYHQTIHLTINQGVNDAWNLIWTPYIGFDYSSYKIMRKTDSDDYEQIATVSASFSSFTDLTAPPGEVFYRIKIDHPFGCNPASREREYASVYSNVASNGIVSVSEKNEPDFTIYPIPADKQLNVSFGENIIGNARLILSDLTGRVVYSEEFRDVLPGQSETINILNFKEGIYLLHLSSGKNSVTRKIVIK